MRCWKWSGGVEALRLAPRRTDGVKYKYKKEDVGEEGKRKRGKAGDCMQEGKVPLAKGRGR